MRHAQSAVAADTFAPRSPVRIAVQSRRIGSVAGAILVVLSIVVGTSPAGAAASTTPAFVQMAASTTKTKFAPTNPVAAGDLLVA
ncbi:MAG: hypothetical protein E6I95_04990, partial [Chloroflexi bacterium]